MTYKDWKKTFVNGGSKGDLKKVDASDIIKAEDVLALREAIFNKNKGFLNDTQQKEFQTILDGMGKEQLTLYDKLSENFASNEYHHKGGAAYYPWERKVKMNIDSNSWDRAVESGYTGAWNTKFHEEFHQLDHILGLNKTKFAKTASGSFVSKFTDISTDYGKRMIQAIDDDILSAINKAVDWRNAERVADGMFGYIPTSSMEPTFETGSLILGLRLFDELETGDIIIFRHNSSYLVKRIAACEGDTIVHQNSVVTVSENGFYVLGDNAKDSHDSRYWDNPFVSYEDVMAKLLLPPILDKKRCTWM